MNKPKAKGTGGETELRKLLAKLGLYFHRTPASSAYDLDRGNKPEGHEVLATRPDHGRWLITMTVEDWAALVLAADALYDIKDLPVHIEVKRYRKFAHHTIYESKFGRS